MSTSSSDIRFLNVSELAVLGTPPYEIVFARVELQRSPGYLADRLKALGFVGFDRILDCACGIGHWTAVAATLNRQVVGLDYNPHRVRIAHAQARANRLTNMAVIRGDMERLPLASGSFDGIFCYGALMFVRPLTTLREFVRVLRPGGLLYLNANGAGWYWVELVRRALVQGNPRLLRAVLATTLRSWQRRRADPDRSNTILGRDEVRRMCEMVGLRVIGVADEGHYGSPKVPPLYAGRYGPLDGVFEVVAIRRDSD
jgi:SAM-dependent methyltransferase